MNKKWLRRKANICVALHRAGAAAYLKYASRRAISGALILAFVRSQNERTFLSLAVSA
jgi:hypothetical protein